MLSFQETPLGRSLVTAPGKNLGKYGQPFQMMRDDAEPHPPFQCKKSIKYLFLVLQAVGFMVEWYGLMT
jgi:hypothetical protein